MNNKIAVGVVSVVFLSVLSIPPYITVNSAAGIIHVLVYCLGAFGIAAIFTAIYWVVRGRGKDVTSRAINVWLIVSVSLALVQSLAQFVRPS
jgi:uncharacterized PurR-regulated membrane protein YhhQ (DUF165 family)